LFTATGASDESLQPISRHGRSAMSAFLLWLLILLVAIYLVVAMLYPDKF